MLWVIFEMVVLTLIHSDMFVVVRRKFGKQDGYLFWDNVSREKTLFMYS